MGRYIDPRPQYFDDAGDPLIAGKVFIFNSGSAVDKDLFFDVNLSIVAPNPVTLSASGRMPNTFFSGTAKATLTNGKTGAGEVQFWSIDPIETTSAGQGGFPDWNAITVWNIPDYVIGSDDKIYCSFINNNQDNDPVSSTAAWEQVEFIGIFNLNIAYVINDIVKASDGNLYRAVTANTGNDPVAESGDWTAAVNITGSTLARTYASALSF